EPAEQMATTNVDSNSDLNRRLGIALANILRALIQKLSEYRPGALPERTRPASRRAVSNGTAPSGRLVTSGRQPETNTGNRRRIPGGQGAGRTPADRRVAASLTKGSHVR